MRTLIPRSVPERHVSAGVVGHSQLCRSLAGQADDPHILSSLSDLSGSVDVCSMVDVDDPDRPVDFADLVDDAIGADSCGVKAD